MLFINHQMLTQETSIRYLGFYVDYNTSWKTHITNTSKKNQEKYTNVHVGILSKLRYLLSTNPNPKIGFTLSRIHLLFEAFVPNNF